MEPGLSCLEKQEHTEGNQRVQFNYRKGYERLKHAWLQGQDGVAHQNVARTLIPAG